VTQGYNGKYSHTGSNQYATDWQMPEGTPVYAARGGIVAKLKDDSDQGGPSMKFDRYNNYVLIRHDDGTLGHYCHLKKGGVCVKVGQIVRTGDLLAHSGNTGFSTGAHLHFCVFKTLNGHERKSLPVQFRTAKEEAVTLLSGHRYRAATLPTESQTPASLSEHASAAGKSHT
jgi:murein DD-endopeptidase MepM/ murein hydrolase activator NlpD